MLRRMTQQSGLGIVLIEAIDDGGLQFIDAFEHASADAVVRLLLDAR